MNLQADTVFQQTGAVVIGRNEGVRLQTCLESLVQRVVSLVYVDSGSTDDSVNIARKLGVSVLELDMSIPFTAARARNEGFSELVRLFPLLEYVQFVDGDCEVVDGWIDAALQSLAANMDVAIVCGRRKERFPENSVYNQLCDIEWDTPIGEANACGGDALIRVRAFKQVKGYKPDLIAGEEPEMCVRLRQNGWKIWRLDADMTLHDANMNRFSQWWKRAIRAGYAYAEGASIHGDSKHRHWVDEVRSNWIWGMSFPVFLILGLIWPITLLLLFVYPLQSIRIYARACLHRSVQDRKVFAIFCVIAKLPLMLGQIKFHLNQMTGRDSQIIEYK